MKRILLFSLMLLAAASCIVTAAAQEESGQDQVTLRFSWWGGEGRHNATLAAIDAFKAAFPSIAIEPEYQGWDGYHTKLKTQIAGGSAPDIAQTDVKEMPGIMSQGDVFYDMKTLDIDMSGFDMNFVENWGLYNDKIVGLPTGTNGQISIFNADLMNLVGAPLESQLSWEDVLTYGKKLKAAYPDKYMILLDPMQVYFHILNAYICQATGTGMFTDDNDRSFDEDIMVEALSLIKNMIDSGVMVPFEQSAVHSVNQMENPLWTGGDVAMYLNFTTHIPRAQAGSAGAFDVTSGPLPQKENALQTGVIVQPAQLICINAKTAYPEESAIFVDYFFNNADSQEALELQRSVPAVVSARELLESMDMLDPTLNNAVNLALENIGKPFNVVVYNGEIQDIVVSAIEAVGYDTMSPEAAAKEAIRNLDAKLGEF